MGHKLSLILFNNPLLFSPDFSLRSFELYTLQLFCATLKVVQISDPLMILFALIVSIGRLENSRFIDLGRPKVDIMPQGRPLADVERRHILRASQVGGQSANKKRKMSTDISSIDRVRFLLDFYVLHINVIYFGRFILIKFPNFFISSGCNSAAPDRSDPHTDETTYSLYRI
jgi:hypothetical protein